MNNITNERRGAGQVKREAERFENIREWRNYRRPRLGEAYCARHVSSHDPDVTPVRVLHEIKPATRVLVAV